MANDAAASGQLTNPPPRYEATMMQRRMTHTAMAAALLIGVAPMTAMPRAGADVVAYLVNVTMRPGYNFANADAALAYGHSLCDRLSQGRTYAQLIGDIKADFNTTDDYQASYLLSQAVNELCPALIWQLRNSAARR